MSTDSTKSPEPQSIEPGAIYLPAEAAGELRAAMRAMRDHADELQKSLAGRPELDREAAAAEQLAVSLEQAGRALGG
jgi:hypothetical protein